MKQFKFLVFGFALCIFSCNSTNNSLAQENQNEYDRYKAKFDNNLISQFPENLSSEINSITANTSIKNNNIGLFLYEYELSTNRMDSLASYLANTKKVANYASSDTCLLVVNRFGIKYTAENGIIPSIKDSSEVAQPCYDNLYPIPNFNDYKGMEFTECGLDKTFIIYVLEAKSGKYSDRYNLKPSVQMPRKWANGHSKGIAISKQKKAVIYWSIIW